MRIRALKGLALFAVVTASGASAAVINVPDDIASLSVAVAVAVDGDEIVIAGSAAPYLVFPGLVVTDKTLTIRGATGNPADVVVDGAGLDIVLRISGSDSDGTVLQDLTVQNGFGATAANSSGAGIRIVNANTTISNCVIRGNVLNAPDGNGAGLYATVSDIVLDRCVIEDNAVGSVSGDGMGVYFNGGSILITDTLFRDNRLPETIAVEPASSGGGLYMDGGSLVVIRCAFENNRAGYGGGIYLVGNMQSATIDESVFVGGDARGGGGLFITGAAGPLRPLVRNSLFAGNEATANDAAIFTDKSSVLTNLTLVGNIAQSSYIIGGNAPAGSVIIDNSILWGNTYNESNGIFPASTPEVVRRCILQQPFTGAVGSGFNQVIDPMFVNAASGDFRLTPMSPAIDAGDTNLYFGPFADLDGAARVVDVPGVADTGFALSGPVIDIGAFEFQTAGPVDTCPTDTNGDGTINFADLNAVLSIFGTDCD